MTTWSGAQIARWLTDAGFSGDEVVHGVALALAASGGADHYQFNPTSVPSTERRGLYGMARHELPTVCYADLFDPVQATEMLRVVYLGQGNRWDWHPVHNSGAALAQEPMIRLMLKQPAPGQPAVDTGGMMGALGRMVGARKAIQQAGVNRGP